MNTKYNEIAKKNAEMQKAVTEGRMTMAEYEVWCEKEYRPEVIRLSHEIMDSNLASMTKKEYKQWNKEID